MAENLSTLLTVLQAFNAGDLDAVRDYVDPDVTYRIPGRARVSGSFTGIDEVAAAFQRLRDLSGGTIAVAPDVVVADGDNVLFTARVTAQHEGRSLDVLNAYAFRFRDGRMTDGAVFPGDQHAVEDFFGTA